MFALATEIRVSSQALGNEPLGFKIDVPKFKAALQNSKSVKLEEFVPEPFSEGHGTRIELRGVLPTLKTTESYLRVKLARRFSVIDGDHGMAVSLNGQRITKEDRGFYKHVQFLWAFDEKTRDELTKIAHNIARLPVDQPGEVGEACVAVLPSTVLSGEATYQVRGYIASVEKPKQLGSGDDSANLVSVFANGRVFAEDVLPEASNAMYYQNYLVGEIDADSLDEDDVDRATASREAIKKDDPRYQALLAFIRTRLAEVGEQWDDWRDRLGLDQTDPMNATVLEWVQSLDDARDRKVAIRLMTSIKNAIVHPDEAKNETAKRVLYRGAIVGFEKLRLTKQLDRLANVFDVLSPEFAAIFASLEQVEETAYAEITRQRLEVIKKFANIANDPGTLERVAQLYLFEHLWLLEPGWDRVTGRAEMELTLTEHLKKEQPDSTGARLDISYRASSGRHIVVELKKPTKTALNYIDLYTQVTKYKDAVEAYYRDKEPNKPVPPLDIYLLVAKTPVGFDESKRKSLAEVNGRLITYAQLINDAKNAYQHYLSVATKTGALEATLRKLL